MKIALLGDYDAGVTAHRAIPLALELAAGELDVDCQAQWIHSSAIDRDAIAGFDAVWCVPRSPYADGEAVIGAIQVARQREIPFLGTCAGYQHALLEYARHELGIADAASSEDDPGTAEPVIDALSCSLIDVTEPIIVDAGSRLGDIYGRPRVDETYHCRFGVNPRYLPRFAGGALRFNCHDEDGQPRGCELDGHRFFFATAFQPERAALEGDSHPLVSALLRAAL